MITTELKDQILYSIVESAPDLYFSSELDSIAIQHNTTSGIVDALLREYENKGFMSVDRMLGGYFICHIEIKAHDFVKAGGYKFEDAVASIQLEKLTVELESLYDSIPKTKYNLIMASVSAIAAALALSKG